MGREWIPIDIDLETKPEILEIMEATGCGPEVAVYRLFKLWGWFSLNSADGAAKATPERLSRVCGGDAEFWLAVERAGWIQFDQSAQIAHIPRWSLRFSAGAKARAVDSSRKSRSRGRKEQMSGLCPGVPGQMSAATVTREEDISSSSSSSSDLETGKPGSGQPDAVAAAAEPAWPDFLRGWNAGAGVKFYARMPAPFVERMRDGEWLEQAGRAIAALPACKFFESPVPLLQFLRPGFVDDVLAGKYANAKRAARVSAPPQKLGLLEQGPPREFTGTDAARFEATRQRELQKLKEACGD